MRMVFCGEFVQILYEAKKVHIVCKGLGEMRARGYFLQLCETGDQQSAPCLGLDPASPNSSLVHL
jgi:hypothetical protein